MDQVGETILVRQTKSWGRSTALLVWAKRTSPKAYVSFHLRYPKQHPRAEEEKINTETNTGCSESLDAFIFLFKYS